jgi:signal transduction histidine kinase
MLTPHRIHSMTDPAARQLASSQPGSESLQRLTQFSRDLGRMTTVSCLAERIVGELCDITRCADISLYLAERDQERYRRLAAQGASGSLAPSHMPFDHPLIQHLSDDQQILEETMCTPQTSLTAASENLVNALTMLSISAAIPLVTKGQLVAFVLVHSPQLCLGLDSGKLELVTAMAQTAANALDSLMVYEDLHRSQALMRRTDRLRSLEIIAGGFAHEIRNPLTSIKTFIQLAPERKDDVEFIRDFSKIVLDDVHRIERLIQEILDYARYMEPKLTDEDLNDIVSSCLYFIEVKADSRGIKIEKELASGLPRVMLDRQQIKQVLLNLLLNAMDAIGERGGALRVRTSTLTKPDATMRLQIEIQDSGPGISPANLEHIFDPFFTTKHTSGENEGTGLGLTIAHQIIQEHHGDIQVHSVEGIGTTFRITLPSLHE